MELARKQLKNNKSTLGGSKMNLSKNMVSRSHRDYKAEREQMMEDRDRVKVELQMRFTDGRYNRTLVTELKKTFAYTTYNGRKCLRVVRKNYDIIVEAIFESQGEAQYITVTYVELYMRGVK